LHHKNYLLFYREARAHAASIYHSAVSGNTLRRFDCLGSKE